MTKKYIKIGLKEPPVFYYRSVREAAEIWAQQCNAYYFPDHSEGITCPRVGSKCPFNGECDTVTSEDWEQLLTELPED